MFCSIPIVRLLAACAPVDPERGTRDGDESLPGESGAELSLHDRKAEKRQNRTLEERRKADVPAPPHCVLSPHCVPTRPQASLLPNEGGSRCLNNRAARLPANRDDRLPHPTRVVTLAPPYAPEARYQNGGPVITETGMWSSM